MYSIGTVIYGIPINDDIAKVAADRDEELDKDDGGYFHTLYHGGSYREVGYLGVELASFDECTDFELEDIFRPPTEAQILEVVKAFNELPIEYKDVAPDISVWVIFSTS